MAPSHHRGDSSETEIRYAIGECSLGPVLVARSNRGICAIALSDDPDILVRDLRRKFPKAKLVARDAGLQALMLKILAFIETPALDLEVPLDIRGTLFQKKVWQALREIPAGSTASYTDIANRIGSPTAVRAVAQACAANPLAIAIPCHRVVRNDGALSGYHWGAERKRALLQREAKAFPDA